MAKKTVRDIDVQGKRVLVRVDFNVPLDKKTGTITDDTRIRAALPTIEYLLDHKATVILMSHLGRPDGKVVPALSLKPVAVRLSELLNKPVQFVPAAIGSQAEQAVKNAHPGDVILLENLRFYPEEEKNDPEFAKQLASLADVYVDDAFGAVHRAHASIHAIAQFLPAVSGFLLDREIDFLTRVTANPEHPFIAIIGGSKISTKIDVLQNLLPQVDRLLIGGGMANTFLKAQGKQIGKSLVENDKLDEAKQMLAQFAGKIVLPVDAVIAPSLDQAGASQRKTVSVDDVPADMMIVDIGPRTIAEFKQDLAGAKTVLWNGPMGVFEVPEFGEGTRGVAEALAALAGKATTVVGGGDSVAAIEQLGLGDKFSHVSTGGGASLEFLEGKQLPGIAVLQDK